jgi:branched-chain amino acid transport system permease protein
MAAGVAWVVGKITLGLRSDYLAIATLGISEIIIAVLKNEDWLARGVKNVAGLDRPVPFELDLQSTPWFIDMVQSIFSGRLAALVDTQRADALNQLVIQSSSIFVKLCYTGLFTVVLVVILLLSIKALNSPWGRMMRAIRDNEEAANAMGKNVVRQHLQVFVLGSAVVGIAGAMLVTLDGQFTPSSYQPLRFTFLVWLMVIVGGSGNNLGAVFGGFFIWFMWIEAEPLSIAFMDLVTAGMDQASGLRDHLLKSAPHLRLFIMGLTLLLTMRFMPKGIIPEETRLHSV